MKPAQPAPSASPESVAHLIDAARAGDPAACDRLMRLYQPHLIRLSRRRSGGATGMRPSDLMQDTAERVVRSLHRFRGTTDPELRRFFAVVLHNILSQHHRDASRLRRAPESVGLPDCEDPAMAAPQPGPSQILRGKQAYRDLLAAVFALPDSQRDAVRLHLHGAPVADIAARLGRTPAAVSCLLQRGGKQVQQALGEQGELGAWFQAMRALLAAAD